MPRRDPLDIRDDGSFPSYAPRDVKESADREPMANPVSELCHRDKVFRDFKEMPNPYGFIKAAIEEGYKEPTSNEEAKEIMAGNNSAIAWNTFSESAKFTVKGIEITVDVLREYVEIHYGSVSKIFKYTDVAFYPKLKKYLVEIGIVVKL